MIKVTIDLNELQHVRGGQKGQEQWINDKLFDAGIPVKGAFSFEGVRIGTITTNADFTTNTLTFVWEEEKPLDKGPDVRDTTH